MFLSLLQANTWYLQSRRRQRCTQHQQHSLGAAGSLFHKCASEEQHLSAESLLRVVSLSGFCPGGTMHLNCTGHSWPLFCKEMISIFQKFSYKDTLKKITWNKERFLWSTWMQKYEKTMKKSLLRIKVIGSSWERTNTVSFKWFLKNF